MIAEGSHIAVIDDVQTYAETAAGVIEEAGLIPAIITEGHGAFQRTQKLLEVVRDHRCTAVVCDHRLSQTQFASFTGAEFVSRLYRERIPGVLISTFSAIDSDASIRLYRAELPSVIGRDELGPDHVMEGLVRCASELAGHVAADREGRRTLLRVTGVGRDGADKFVEAIVHTWNPDHAVRFPMNLIKEPHVRRVLDGEFANDVRLFAEVNVGCGHDSELFFESFELAPDPDVGIL